MFDLLACFMAVSLPELPPSCGDLVCAALADALRHFPYTRRARPRLSEEPCASSTGIA